MDACAIRMRSGYSGDRWTAGGDNGPFESAFPATWPGNVIPTGYIGHEPRAIDRIGPRDGRPSRVRRHVRGVTLRMRVSGHYAVLQVGIAVGAYRFNGRRIMPRLDGIRGRRRSGSRARGGRILEDPFGAFQADISNVAIIATDLAVLRDRSGDVRRIRSCAYDRRRYARRDVPIEARRATGRIVHFAEGCYHGIRAWIRRRRRGRGGA